VDLKDPDAARTIGKSISVCSAQTEDPHRQ